MKMEDTLTKPQIKRISLFGEIYWLSGNLISPLSHFDETGELLISPFSDVSYAAIEGDDILRFHKVIGSVKKDIKCVR